MCPQKQPVSPEAASTLRGPWWEQDDGGASSQASEEGHRTEGASDAANDFGRGIFPG